MFKGYVKAVSMLAMLGLCVVFPVKSNAVLINFDELARGMNPLGAGGLPVPSHAQLSDHYLSTYGVRFFSSGTFVAIVDLDNGLQAPSSPNGIAGSTVDGLLFFSNVTARFFDPAAPNNPAVTDYVAVTADKWGSSPGNTVTLNAYDVDGILVDSYTTEDTGGETLHVSAPAIHTVQFLCNQSPDAAIDNFTFNTIRPGPILQWISPNAGSNIGVQNNIRLTGLNLFAGAVVKLSKAGQSDILATTATGADGNTLTCSFDLTGRPAGYWDVVVSTNGMSSMVPSGFEITMAKITRDHVRIDNPVYDMKYPMSFMFALELVEDGRVDMKVLNSRGELIKVLSDEMKYAGINTISWDGRNESGEKVGSGIYFIQTITRELETLNKIVVIK